MTTEPSRTDDGPEPAPAVGARGVRASSLVGLVLGGTALALVVRTLSREWDQAEAHLREAAPLVAGDHQASPIDPGASHV